MVVVDVFIKSSKGPLVWDDSRTPMVYRTLVFLAVPAIGEHVEITEIMIDRHSALLEVQQVRHLPVDQLGEAPKAIVYLYAPAEKLRELSLFQEWLSFPSKEAINNP